MSEHTVPMKTYAVIFALLAGLTILTWRVAQIDLRVFNAVVALIIAFIKASLVALFFMHVRWSSRLTRIVIGGSLFWLLILLALTLGDYVTRLNLRYPGNG